MRDSLRLRVVITLIGWGCGIRIIGLFVWNTGH
jgi:hypothetical protein